MSVMKWLFAELDDAIWPTRPRTDGEAHGFYVVRGWYWAPMSDAERAAIWREARTDWSVYSATMLWVYALASVLAGRPLIAPLAIVFIVGLGFFWRALRRTRS